MKNLLIGTAVVVVGVILILAALLFAVQAKAAALRAEHAAYAANEARMAILAAYDDTLQAASRAKGDADYAGHAVGITVDAADAVAAAYGTKITPEMLDAIIENLYRNKYGLKR